MKANRIRMLLAALSMAAALPALAAEPAKKPVTSAPTAEDLKKSRDRGIYFKDMSSGQAVGVTQITVGSPDHQPTKKAKGVSRVSDPQYRSLYLAPTTPVPPGIKGAPKTTRPSSGVAKVGGDGKQQADAGTTTSALVPAHGDAIPVSHIQSLADFSVKARLNKDGLSPRYRVGERMEVLVTASADCNIAVFDYDSQGTLTQVFPNDFQQSSFLRAGESVRIGGADSPFEYQVGGNGGAEKVFVYAYPTGTSNPLTTVAFNPVPQSPFRAAPLTLQQYRELVNGSRVFFDREISVTAKARLKQGQAAQAPAPAPAPNKVELTYEVEAK